jgi:hypothetical protein
MTARRSVVTGMAAALAAAALSAGCGSGAGGDRERPASAAGSGRGATEAPRPGTQPGYVAETNTACRAVPAGKVRPLTPAGLPGHARRMLPLTAAKFVRVRSRPAPGPSRAAVGRLLGGQRSLLALYQQALSTPSAAGAMAGAVEAQERMVRTLAREAGLPACGPLSV